MSAGRSPLMPTQAEVEDHRVSHLPYRDWCEDCVAGRATGEPHKSNPVKSRFPVIAIDYFFLTKDDLCAKKDLLQSSGESWRQL